MKTQAFKRDPLRGTEVFRTTPQISLRMARIRQKGTAPELSVRTAARKTGLRFTTTNRDLPGSPDLANRRRQIAIFVHGCYWHRHAGCPKATTPRSNASFWLEKFDRNQARDRSAIRALRRLGYRVWVVWQCETADERRLAQRLSEWLAESA